MYLSDNTVNYFTVKQSIKNKLSILDVTMLFNALNNKAIINNFITFKTDCNHIHFNNKIIIIIIIIIIKLKKANINIWCKHNSWNA